MENVKARTNSINNNSSSTSEHSRSDFDIIDIVLQYTDSYEDSPKFKALIDAGIILDVFLGRDSIYLSDAIKIMDLVLTGKLIGYIGEAGLRNIWNTARTLKGRKVANGLIVKMMNSFRFCKLDLQTINKLKYNSLISHESSIQVEYANKYHLDAIITLRDQDFLKSPIQNNIFSPKHFLEFFHNSDNRLLSINNNSVSIEDLKRKLSQSVFISNLEEDNNEDNELTIDPLELFGGWKVEYFELLCSNNNLVSSTVVLQNKNDKTGRITESAFGSGAISTLFSAVDRAISHCIPGKSIHFLETVKLSSLEKGIDAPVSISLVVRYGDYKIRKFQIHKNVIKSYLYCYIKAIKHIYGNGECENSNFEVCSLDDVKVSMFSMEVEEIINFFKMGQTDFSQTNLREIDLSHQVLPSVSLRKCDLSFAIFDRINLSNADLEEAVLNQASLFHANLREANLYKATLQKAVMNKIDLASANLNCANLSGADLDNANLSGANLFSASLSNADLTEADLQRANVSEVNLSHATLVCANLTGANLSGANLRFADLTGADLTGANLTYADLTGADLSETTLTNAIFSSTNLTDSKLYNAYLDGAIFSKANFSNVDLSELDLNKAIVCQPVLVDTKMPEIKIEIYGDKRLEKIIQLFSSLCSDHYVIYAVHSSTCGSWWNSKIGKKFRAANRELAELNIPIKRVFILPYHQISDDVKEILSEQISSGIMIRYLTEDLAKNINGFDLRKTNLLVCKNLAVPKNSFTTMMVVDKNQNEQSGYISYIGDEIQTNEQRFTMIWESATPYLDDLEPQLTSTESP